VEFQDIPNEVLLFISYHYWCGYQKELQRVNASVEEYLHNLSYLTVIQKIKLYAKVRGLNIVIS